MGATLDAQIEDTPVDVLVLGPSVDADRLDAPARLRKALLERCRASGASVKGEHKELIQEAEKRLGEGHNLCLYEVTLAQEVDLIVIIPASPGSLAELGLFASEPNAAHKTIILFSRKYRDDEDSYIMQGPKKVFEMGRARIEYVDYGKPNKAWRYVESAIEQVRALKMGQWKREMRR